MARLSGTLLTIATAVCLCMGCKPTSKPSKTAAPAERQESAQPAAEKGEPVSEGVSNDELKPQPDAPLVKAEPAPTPEPAAAPMHWTSQRLVVMGKGGPRFFKLNVNVSGQDLGDGFQLAMKDLAKELSLNFDAPDDWNTLLDKPLIASGWLGNLVPTAEQREQLRVLYDANNNEKVEEAEFHAFITRGLSRTPHLKLSMRRPAPPLVQTESLWGPIDLDDDGELTANEINRMAHSLSRYDFDSDGAISIAEFRSTEESDPNAMTGKAKISVYDEPPAQLWDIDKPEKIAAAITDYYSLTNGLSRDEAHAWPAKRIEQLDTNKDSFLDKSELRQVSDEQLDAAFDLVFPDASRTDSEIFSVHFHSIDKMDEDRWHGHPEGGRVTLDGCNVTIVIEDGKSQSQREGFTTQFGLYEKDKQLRDVFMRALELKEGAFETLESMAMERHMNSSDLAWNWLVAPRQWHVQINCSASLSPWFELIDQNGDRKLSAKEIEQFSHGCRDWDRNTDGAIQEKEMPVSVLLEVKRSEVRGSGLRLGGTGSEKRGANEVSAPTWFTGMDYNSDGELSPSEFLGERSDFEKLDRNRDGIIEAREVTTPQ